MYLDVLGSLIIHVDKCNRSQYSDIDFSLLEVDVPLFVKKVSFRRLCCTITKAKTCGFPKAYIVTFEKM